MLSCFISAVTLENESVTGTGVWPAARCTHIPHQGAWAVTCSSPQQQAPRGEADDSVPGPPAPAGA